MFLIHGFLTNGEGGKLPGSTSWGIDVHVSTHLLPVSWRLSIICSLGIALPVTDGENHDVPKATARTRK